MRPAIPNVRHSEVLQCLDYCEKTGRFFWKIPNGRSTAGDRAGSNHGRYRAIRLHGSCIYEHRLAWFYMHGRWPLCIIDHINGDKKDNRIHNLRECDHQENCQNSVKSANVKTPYRGVTYHRQTGTWSARISLGRKRHSLGYHSSPEEARAAYLRAKAHLHTFCPIPRDA